MTGEIMLITVTAPYVVKFSQRRKALQLGKIYQIASKSTQICLKRNRESLEKKQKTEKKETSPKGRKTKG